MRDFVIKFLSIILIASLGNGVASASMAETNSMADPKKHDTFEFMHLWIADIEAPALNTFRSAVEELGIRFVEHGVSGNLNGIRSTFARRVSQGLPPDGSFWIGSRQLKEMIDEKVFRLIRLDPKLLDDFLPEIRTHLQYKNGLMSFPFGIHVQNFALYNRKIYHQLSLPYPNSWKEFIKSAPRIKKAGYIPLSMSDELWQFRFLFLGIVGEQLEASDLKYFISGHGKYSPQYKQGVLRALQILDQLRVYTNKDHRNLLWQDAVKHVRDDRAAAIIHGDFMTPVVRNWDKFSCGLSPGNKSIIWSLDVMVFPAGVEKKQVKIQDSVIRKIAHEKFWKDYVAKKGGLPITKTVHLENLNKCSRVAYEQWQRDIPKIQLKISEWKGRMNQISLVLQNFWNNQNYTIEHAVQKLLLIK